jgi:hypothetical protein
MNLSGSAMVSVRRGASTAGLYHSAASGGLFRDEVGYAPGVITVWHDGPMKRDGQSI